MALTRNSNISSLSLKFFTEGPENLQSVNLVWMGSVPWPEILAHKKRYKRTILFSD